MKQVLIETQTFNTITELISEGKTTKRGNPVVEGILATVEVKNGNGRYYPKSLWEREMDKYSQLIKENRAVGELDHPESQVINLKNVSHNIKDISWDGKNIMGTIEILPTPSGNILKELFKSGIKLGFSSRGMGSVKEVFTEGDTSLEVQPDFELIAFDFVSNPSTHGAFLSPVNESKGTKSVNKFAGIERIITDIITEF